MKRKELLRHLTALGCELLREGGRHSWWHNPKLNKRSAVPRHSEIGEALAKKICKDLGIQARRICCTCWLKPGNVHNFASQRRMGSDLDMKARPLADWPYNPFRV
ncbi:MAG: type II toxin-antitoxin system HicA family toxin [Acidobacteria bacterium]|nr:type II toxin-antitoxin system HicA family toxin [Acidobacteriota bacterium]